MYSNLLNEFKNAENLRIKNFSFGVGAQKRVEIEILSNRDYLKWDYFVYKLRQKSEKEKIKNIVIKKNYPLLSFSFSSNEKIAESQIEVFRSCLHAKYYLIEKPKYHHLTAIMKVTSDCNLNCEYCYDIETRKKLSHTGVLSLETIDHLLEMMGNATENLMLIWHGGEPTLAGIEYYKKIYTEIIPKYPYLEITSEIQTNATLLDKKWFSFLEEHHIGLGTSNNLLYENLRTLETEEENIVFRKIKFGKMCSSCDSGCIEVITSKNVKDIIKIYEEYKRNRINVSFNFVFEAGNAAENKELLLEKEYEFYLKEYMRHWLYDKTAVYERFAALYFYVILNLKAEICYKGDCRFHFMGVDANGDVYPCDRPLAQEYRIGNIAQFDSIDELFMTKEYHRFAYEIDECISHFCSKCNIYSYCSGNCPMKKYDKNKSFLQNDKKNCNFERFLVETAFKLLWDIRSIDEVNPTLREKIENNYRILPCEIPILLKDNELFAELDFSSFKGFDSREFRIFDLLNIKRDEEYFLSLEDDTCSCRNKCGEPREPRKAEDRIALVSEYLDQIAVKALNKTRKAGA